MVRPSRLPIPLIEAIVQEVIQSIRHDNVTDTDAAVAVDVASELLAGTHEWSYSTPKSVTFGARPLRDIPEVQQLRDCGLKIFKILLNNNNYMTAAFEIAEHVGDADHRIDSGQLPLAQRIKQDREAVLSEIKKLDLDSLHLPIVSKLEDLLMHWWLTDQEGADEAVDILKKIQRKPLYLFIRHYIPSRYIVYDFDELFSRSPTDDKWKWWCHHEGKLTWQADDEELKELTEQLAKVYSTVDQLKSFLVEADTLCSQLNSRHNPPILRHWVDLNPSLFLNLLNKYGWDSIPEIFKGHISAAIAKHKPGYITEKCAELQDKLPNLSLGEFQNFINTILSNDVPYGDVQNCFSDIAKKADLSIRTAFLHTAYFYFVQRNDPDSYVKLVIECTHDRLDKEFMDNQYITRS